MRRLRLKTLQLAPTSCAVSDLTKHRETLAEAFAAVVHAVQAQASVRRLLGQSEIPAPALRVAPAVKITAQTVLIGPKGALSQIRSKQPLAILVLTVLPVKDRTRALSAVVAVAAHAVVAGVADNKSPYF
jgi:hypothetical protein